jgi:hypothetical protein
MPKTKEEIEAFRAARAVLKAKIEKDILDADKLIAEARVLQHSKDFHGALLKYEAALVLLTSDEEASWTMLQKKRERDAMVRRDVDAVLSVIDNWLDYLMVSRHADKCV